MRRGHLGVARKKRKAELVMRTASVKNGVARISSSWLAKARAHIVISWQQFSGVFAVSYIGSSIAPQMRNRVPQYSENIECHRRGDAREGDTSLFNGNAIS